LSFWGGGGLLGFLGGGGGGCFFLGFLCGLGGFLGEGKGFWVFFVFFWLEPRPASGLRRPARAGFGGFCLPPPLLKSGRGGGGGRSSLENVTALGKTARPGSGKITNSPIPLSIRKGGSNNGNYFSNAVLQAKQPAAASATEIRDKRAGGLSCHLHVSLVEKARPTMADPLPLCIEIRKKKKGV